MKLLQVTLIVLLAAILLPLTTWARDEFVTLQKDDSILIIERSKLLGSGADYYRRQGYTLYVDERERGNLDYTNSLVSPLYDSGYNSDYQASSESKAEGFSIGANIKLGKLGRVNLGYTKAKAKTNVQAKSEVKPTVAERPVGLVTEPMPVQSTYQLMKIVINKEPEKLVSITIKTNKTLVVDSLIIFSRDNLVIAEYQVTLIEGNLVNVQAVFENTRPGNKEDTFVIH